MTGPAPAPERVRRMLWRWWLRLRYQRAGRRRGPVLERVDGASLLVLPEVFNPVLFRTGAFLARSIRPPAASTASAPAAEPTALDIGTGSGIGAIFAARCGYRVVGVDINPAAVRCARINVLLNGLDGRAEIRHGDLFAPVAGDRFDLVLFNPPFYRGMPSGPLDQAWRAPDVMERFAMGLTGVLRPGAQALIVLSTDGEWPTMLAALDGAGFDTRPLVRRDFGNEVLCVYSVRAMSDRAAALDARPPRRT